MLNAVSLQTVTTKPSDSLEKQEGINRISDPKTTVNVICRTCLSTEDLQPLFDDSDHFKMSQKLKLVTGLEIKKSDGLSQKICQKCLNAIEYIINFRLKSKQAQEYLLSMTNLKEIKKEYSDQANKLGKEFLYKVDIVKLESNKDYPFLDSLKKLRNANIQIGLIKQPKPLTLSDGQDSAEYDDDINRDFIDSDTDSDSKEDLKPLSLLSKEKVENITAHIKESKPFLTIKKVKVEIDKSESKNVKVKKKKTQIDVKDKKIKNKSTKDKNIKCKDGKIKKRSGTKKFTTFIRVQNLPPDYERFVMTKTEPESRKRTVKRVKKAAAKGDKEEKPLLIKVANLPEDLDQIPRVKVPRPQRRRELPAGPPYKCTSCDKEYSNRAVYLAHVRFHTHYHVCELCGKICQNRYALQQHQRGQHSLDKVLRCTRCEYSASTRTALAVHERRHAGERPFVCDHCAAAFYTRRTLAQHVGVHMPPDIQCPLCPKKLRSMRLLSNHKSRKHAKKYSYLCPVCPKVFNDNNCVHKHLSGYHGIPRPEHPPIEKQQRI